MKQAEAIAAGIFEGRNSKGVIDGLIVGQSNNLRTYLWYRGDGHTMIIAPPGSGKGQGFVLPNLLTYPGSMLVVDPKGENAAMTARHRREKLGQGVYVIDPFGLSEQPSASFNPLDWLRTTEPKYFFEDCDLLAKALVAPEAAQYAHFHDEAVNLMRALILYLFAHEPHNFNLNRLHDLALSPIDYWNALFALMAESEFSDFHIRRIIRNAGNWFTGLGQTAKENHRNTVQKNLQWLAGLALAPVVRKSDFDVKSLKAEPTTVYLCIPGESRELYKPYVRCLVTLALLGMYRTRGIGSLPVQFMCDEFYTTVGNLDIIDNAVGDMRGYGARFAFILQDLSQLQKLYPDTWKAFESSCGAVIYIGADKDTAEHVSKRLGEEEYLERPGGSFNNGAEVITRQSQWGRRPLHTPQQIAQLGPRKEIIFIQHLPPMMADRVTAYEDRNFHPFMDENPTRCPALPGSTQGMDMVGFGKPIRTVDDFLAGVTEIRTELDEEIDEIFANGQIGPDHRERG